MVKSKKKLPDKKGDKREYKVGDKKPPKEYQFKKGEIHNPAGRPPNIKYISDLLRDKIKEICGSEDKFTKILDGIYEVGTEEITFGKVLVAALLKHSLKGNPAMMKELLDRIEGKVPLPIEGGDIAKPVFITYVPVKAKRNRKN